MDRESLWRSWVWVGECGAGGQSPEPHGLGSEAFTPFLGDCPWHSRREGGQAVSHTSHPFPAPPQATVQRTQARDSLSSCVIWASWACFFKLLYVFVSLPQTMLLIFTILGCEGERLCFKKPLAPNRGTQRKNYYLFEMSYKAQVHVCTGRGLGVTLLVTDSASHHIWSSMIFYWRRSTKLSIGQLEFGPGQLWWWNEIMKSTGPDWSKTFLDLTNIYFIKC